MTWYAALGAIEQGLVYGIMVIGVYLTFRILDFQDKVIEARLRKATALTDFNKGLAGLYLAMGINLERLNIAYDAKNPEKNNATN